MNFASLLFEANRHVVPKKQKTSSANSKEVKQTIAEKRWAKYKQVFNKLGGRCSSIEFTKAADVVYGSAILRNLEEDGKVRCVREEKRIGRNNLLIWEWIDDESSL